MKSVKFYFILFSIGVLSTLSSYAQNEKCNIPINIGECGITYDFSRVPDTVTIKFTSTKNAKVILYDCKGSMQVKIFDEGNLIASGNYINAIDTSVVKLTTIDNNGKDVVESIKVFIPIKDGVWSYYTKDGELLRKEKHPMLPAKNNCEFDIYIDEWHKPFLNLKLDTLYTFKYNDTVLKVELYNCRGAMDVEWYDKKDLSMVKGRYLNGLDILKQQAVKKDTNGLKVYVEKYFRPLKHGTWEYYKNGSLVKYENYIKGIKIYTKDIKD